MASWDVQMIPPSPSFSVSLLLLMSEDSTSFELSDFPARVVGANMTSTPEKQPQPTEPPNPAEDPTTRAELPFLEEFDVWGRVKESNSEDPTSPEKPKDSSPLPLPPSPSPSCIKELTEEELENRFRNILPKANVAGRGWRVRGLETRTQGKEDRGRRAKAVIIAGIVLLLAIGWNVKNG